MRNKEGKNIEGPKNLMTKNFFEFSKIKIPLNSY